MNTPRRVRLTVTAITFNRDSGHTLEFASFNLDAEGLLGSADGIWRFTEIKLRPVVTILNEKDRDRVIYLLEKAEKSCLIARSLQFKVTLAPVVKVEVELAVPARI